jgi:hypothetical protein
MRWALLAIVGAVLCTLGDHLHATHGVLTYPHVWWWDQAWWVLPLFAGASLTCVGSARWFWSLGGPHGMPDARSLLADGVGFFAAYAYTSFAPADRPNVTLAVLVIAFLVRMVGERRPTWLFCYCVLLAIGGACFESALSSTGAFAYVHPDLLRVPRWLPAIYLHAGILAGSLSVPMFSRPELRASPGGGASAPRMQLPTITAVAPDA